MGLRAFYPFDVFSLSSKRFSLINSENLVLAPDKQTPHFCAWVKS
jgi:hypothetical protein